MGKIQGGYILVLAAAVLWGTTGTAQAIGHPEAQPVAVGTLRIIIAGAAFLVLSPFTGLPRRPSGTELPWIAVGALLVLGYQLAFFAAVRMIGVAVGTVLQIGVAPLAAGVLGALFLKERVTLRWLLATALGIGGIALVSLRPEGGTTQSVTTSVQVLGALLAMGAGIAYAGFSLSLRQVGESMGTIPAATLIFSTSALLSIPVALLHDLRWVASVRGSVSLLHLGLVATALAYLLFTRGIRRVHFGSAITATLVEGVTATLLGTLLLRERLETVQALGIAVVLLAVWLSGRSKRPVVDSNYQA